MSAYCYILESEQLGKFYTGSTEISPQDRLKYHLEKRYGNKAFSSSAQDWKLIYSIDCESIQQAREIEAHIKGMKSKQYILNLLKYPEIVQKLKLRYPV